MLNDEFEKKNNKENGKKNSSEFIKLTHSPCHKTEITL